MGLFNSRQPKTPPVTGPPNVTPSDPIPVLPVDLTKRYDVYFADHSHDRLYENVRFVCMRTFDRNTDFGNLGNYLEVEAADGARSLIPQLSIQMICEHGVPPIFTVLRRRRRHRDG